MPKIVDSEKKKNEIAHKALYAFAFDGFHRATMGQIAHMCGIGRSTIYEYFRNKDEIFTYSLEESLDLIALDVDQVLKQPELGCLDRIEEVFRRALSQFAQEKRVLLLLFEHALRIIRENQEVAAALEGRIRTIRGMFESLLEQGIQSGEIRGDPGCPSARQVALVLEALLMALAFRFSSDSGASFDDALAGVRELLEGLRR